ncbi:replication protein [Paraburkholderia sp. BR10872]|uniref:replication protein n=1 Tax=Paraburkholderia sp. BR10872 TaxID=3236989 RepID=UPI0034D2109F
MQDETPQLEDGYTRIANELFEAILGFGFTQRQLLVLLTVLRKTYGYGKKEDDMSAGQIGQMCGVKRNHVSEVIGQLAGMNVLTRRPGVYGLVVGINKNYRRWVVPNRDTLSQIGTTTSSTEDVDLDTTGSSPKSGLVLNRDSSSPESGQVDSPNSGHTKENLPKETQKERAQKNPEFEEAWRLYPERDGGDSKAKALKAWNARIREGKTAAEMTAGLKRYIAYLTKKGDIGTQYVKQAATFFGPDGHYTEAWGQKIGSDADWWIAAGFDKEWKATNAGCTRSNAHQWRDGKRIKG